MITEYHFMGDYWLAETRGPLRLILAEGVTRDHARRHCEDMYQEQQNEFHKLYPMLTMSATGITMR